MDRRSFIKLLMFSTGTFLIGWGLYEYKERQEIRIEHSPLLRIREYLIKAKRLLEEDPYRVLNPSYYIHPPHCPQPEMSSEILNMCIEYCTTHQYEFCEGLVDKIAKAIREIRQVGFSCNSEEYRESKKLIQEAINSLDKYLEKYYETRESTKYWWLKVLVGLDLTLPFIIGPLAVYIFRWYVDRSIKNKKTRLR